MTLIKRGPSGLEDCCNSSRVYVLSKFCCIFFFSNSINLLPWNLYYELGFVCSFVRKCASRVLSEFDRKMFVLLLSLVALCFSYENDELIRAVNEKNAGWKAGKNKFLRDKTDDQVRSLFGMPFFLFKQTLFLLSPNHN